MSTKRTSSKREPDDLRDEYVLDYGASRPNRFADQLAGTTAVILQPDVAEVFRSSKAVNDLLRSAIAATGAHGDRRLARREQSGTRGKRQSR